MLSGPNSDARRAETAWCRGVGLLVCLLALWAALSGNMGPFPPAAADAAQTVIASDNGDGRTDGGEATGDPHCMVHGQCSFPAALPATPAIDLSGPSAAGLLTDWFGNDRAVLPLRRPPRVPETDNGVPS